MNHWWNSLQVRLYGAFGMVIILITLLIISGGYFQNISFDRNDQTRESSQLSTNAYMLITLSHRYIDAPSEQVQSDIKAQIADVIMNSEQILTDLEKGNTERNTPALNIDSLVQMRDQIDAELAQFKPALDKMFASKPGDYEAAVIVIDEAAVNIPDHADKLTEAIDEVSDQEKIAGETITGGIAIMMAIMLIIAAVTVLQSVRAIDKLAKTAEAFAEGDFKVRANIKTMAEISVVGNTFNQMADQISRLITDLENQVQIAENARIRAEQSDQVKSSFLANMSHELRTPLNAIINFSKFVVKGVMGPVTEQQVDALNKVVESGKHLLNLINDVLDISKIESGSLNLFIEPNVDISGIIRETGALSEALLAGKAVEFRLEIADDIPNMSCDKQRVRQIVMNVLSNACKFTEEGFIEICAQTQGGSLHISVKDTGPGIAAEDTNLVFESFKQTGTGLRQGNGTGLGMPISKKLAEALGGKLWFTSEIGKGTTFYIDLPIKPFTPISAIA